MCTVDGNVLCCVVACSIQRKYRRPPRQPGQPQCRRQQPQWFQETTWKTQRWQQRSLSHRSRWPLVGTPPSLVSCQVVVCWLLSLYTYISKKRLLHLKQIFNKYSLDLHVNSCSFRYVLYFFSCQLNSHFLCTCTYMCLKFILNHLLINGWLSCV